MNKIFKPKTVAIIGASNKKGSVGLALLENAKNSKAARKIYPVNIKGKTILGEKSYKFVTDIKKQIDVAVIATPSAVVPKVLKNCAKAKIKNVIIISAGFSEVGVEGKKLFEEIASICEESGLNIVGPNCLGILNPYADLNLSFASKQASKGSVALVSQSGAICTALLDWSEKQEIGFSKFISLGSMLDIGFAQTIDYLNRDKNTRSIVLYVETVNKPQEFIKACRASKKSIFVLKSGRSKAGASAAKSHTGSLAGSDEVFDALFRQAGVTRLDTIQELQDVIHFESHNTPLLAGKLAIVTNAGGPGVICTDFLDSLNFSLAKLSKKTKDDLDKVLPTAWSKSNPIDIIGDAGPKRYKSSLDICLKSKELDSVFALLTPQTMTDSKTVAKYLLDLKIPRTKLVFASFIGGSDLDEAKTLLRKSNFLLFDTPERALLAFTKHVEQSKLIKARQKKERYPDIKLKNKKVATIISAAENEKRKSLSESEVKDILSSYSLPVLKYRLAKTEGEVSRYFKTFDTPVAMKVLSPDILHKIDMGGVELNISSEKEARAAFKRIMINARKKAKGAKLDGVIMEPMLNVDLELIIGLSYDPVLGANIMFGRGGSEVELLADVSFGVLAISLEQIEKMIKETIVSKRLAGYRGMRGLEVKKLTDLIYRISLLAKNFPQIKELDINPLALSRGKLHVLDAKIVLRKDLK